LKILKSEKHNAPPPPENLLMEQGVKGKVKGKRFPPGGENKPEGGMKFLTGRKNGSLVDRGEREMGGKQRNEPNATIKN